MSIDLGAQGFRASHVLNLLSTVLFIFRPIFVLKNATMNKLTYSPANAANVANAARHTTSRGAATLLLWTSLGLLAPMHAALAQTTRAAGSDATTAVPQTWVAGEVRRVDVPQSRLTIRHGDIPHLDMGAMTMVFRLKPGLLSADQLKAMKPGDRVEFQAEAPQGQLTITALRRPMVQPMDGQASDAKPAETKASEGAASAAGEHHHH
ncbi:Cu/Ag efflux protein CusF [Roseateles depolymerans]|uniref:Copper binding periplasmic protein CusF n=2 Tax=Roseateles depolymerans TaxID=76731 RepID=A0A0U3L262_9BURK|nr:Copper binding periplasmic protein CusF [Roseateles depolymerans]REG14578.1 Cu/Ag efflux protein CusF [Roseateles depolymerans]